MLHYKLFSKMLYSYLQILTFVLSPTIIVGGHWKNIAWNGGPMHLKCENEGNMWLRGEQHVKENVIATKALVFQEDIYVITPRMKPNILATLWLIIKGEKGVELQPYPELRTHKLGECNVIQNAVDFYMDHLSKLWILDSGTVDTLSAPKCTCPPKVTVINMITKKLVKIYDVAIEEPNSLLQNIVVEYTLGGKTFIYVSDASRGSILVHDLTTGSKWSVMVCSPAVGLQIALLKQPTHSVLILVRPHHQGIIELDTTALRRKDSLAPLTVFGEQSKPVVLLGASSHHVFFRHTECSDVLVWDTRQPYNASRFNNIHSAGPRLTTTAVTAVPLKHMLLILDSNYLDTLHGNAPTYHKITFIAYRS